MNRLGEALEYGTTRKTEVGFCPSPAGYKTKVRHESMWNLLEQKLKLQVVNYALETNISDGVHKIVI